MSLRGGARAPKKGNHLFGALLTDSAGDVLPTTQNTVLTERDLTGHAETNLVRLASRTLEPSQLLEAAVYASPEPCAMCSGAVYWSGVRRVVYALAATEPECPRGSGSERTAAPLAVRWTFMIREGTGHRRPCAGRGCHRLGSGRTTDLQQCLRVTASLWPPGPR
ncbi:nucleoside deaminase [Streptomyces sp. NRRL S-646]|uniref:nucleoside deaminase n=1 Tax=Streptomyces sp. NRRL S-646 TaxID=1463917 RepID=UPI00099D0BEE